MYGNGGVDVKESQNLHLMLFSGNIALQRYSSAEIEPNARCFWFSVMSEASHLSLLWPFKLTGFFGKMRYHRRE